MSKKMTAEEKKWIDGASYEQLLRRWRFDTLGSKWFNGETFVYYKDRMDGLRIEIGAEEHARISKKVGWDR